MNTKTPRWEWYATGVERLKVTGGWLYKVCYRDGYGNVSWESDHVTFAPNQKKKPRVKIEVVR